MNKENVIAWILGIASIILLTLFTKGIALFFLVICFVYLITAPENRQRTYGDELRKKKKSNIYEPEVISKIPSEPIYMSAEDKQAYLESPEWHKLKQDKLSIANYRCEHCGADEYLELHHISYEKLGSEPLNHLAILCRDCHNELHEIASELYKNDGFRGMSRTNTYPLDLLGQDYKFLEMILSCKQTIKEVSINLGEK